MADVKLIIEAGWVKSSGDCSTCVGCEDMIFGNKYNLSLKIGNKVTETDINLCESCYTEIKDE